MESYAIDFRNNLEVISFKNKIAKEARGIVTVQLFDAETQKKVFEAKTENLITTVGQKFFRWAIQDRIIQNSSATKPAFNNVFNQIQLYTSDKPESDDIFPELGTLVGWADQVSYSGSDALRGTINTAESYFKYDNYVRMHFVFDWPTHAANGTFQTIVWAYDNPISFEIIKTFSIPGENMLYGLAWDGTGLWVPDGYQYKLFKIDANTGSILKDFNIADVYGIAWDGTYLLLSKGSEKKIYKVDPSTGATIATINVPYSFEDITWDGTFIWGVERTTKKIVKIDASTGQELLSFNVLNESIREPRGLVWINGSLLLSDVYDDRIYKINPSNGTAVAKYNANFDWDVNGLAWDGVNLWASGGYNDNVYKLGQALYGARTLLPSPVTKTSTNTMKIQYDFIFQL